MSKVVFVLGAGASKLAGAPLMGNFLDVARDLLTAKKVESRAAEFDLVFRTIGSLQAVHSKAQLDLDNLEAIFTILELGKVIGRVPGTNSLEEIDKAIAALRSLIVGTLEETMKFPYNGRNIEAPKPYGRFASMIEKLLTERSPALTSSIISFNYDLAMDLALYESGLGPDYVIEPAPSHRGQSVRLMKLHGSLNWATGRANSSAGSIAPLHLSDYFGKYSYPQHMNYEAYRPLRVGSTLKEAMATIYGETNVDVEPLIVPPSWNKADYHRALSKVWMQAAQDLSEAERIYVIGYSLPETDSFFRHLYALGSVGDFPLRRFGVYNPDASGATEARFRSLLGAAAASRFQYNAMTFEEAINHIRSDIAS